MTELHYILADALRAKNDAVDDLEKLKDAIGTAQGPEEMRVLLQNVSPMGPIRIAQDVEFEEVEW